MAEAIGLAASIATLCEIAKKVVQIGRNIHHAPAEVRQALRDLNQLSAQSFLFHELCKRILSASAHFEDQLLENLRQSLDLLKEDIDHITANLLKIVPNDLTRESIILWAFFLRKNAKCLMDQLQKFRLTLNTTLSLVLGLESILPRCNESPNQGQNSLLSRNYGKHEEDNSTDLSQPHHRISQGSERREKQSAYAISVTLKLPLAYVLNLKMIWRTYAFNRVKFGNVSSGLKLRCLVEEDSEFMLACKRGSIDTMKFILQNRKAGPDDITAKGKTPLSIAIENGRYDAVKLLLNSGADTNGVFGKRETSPLAKAVKHRHLSIVRLLLEHGACRQHISAYGWTPLSYLWSNVANVDSSSTNEFIQILAHKEDFIYSYANILDIWGFGVIHHAVLYGQADEVVSLIDRGASPYTPQGPLQWDAIQNAVYENRYDVFQALLPYYEDIDVTDTRGWTLLHISASEGHDTITRHLLRRGANWQALSIPSFDVADCLQGKCFTPTEAALGEGGLEDGSRRKRLFLEAVKEIKGVDIDAFETSADVDDIWFDTSGVMET